MATVTSPIALCMAGIMLRSIVDTFIPVELESRRREQGVRVYREPVSGLTIQSIVLSAIVRSLRASAE